ncbi:substrate-binding periplasmic protein [Leptospira johnsonii]|uniref:ABC transporter, substrate-binding protein, family 3 n=1 Tax=Leptospira johnsonii TaxID=1917820 RepID=A0A2P2D288_9LEPT|nr:transporter substrate-binding domain-containing protein [Leptospira johnsonii]GBF38750.1 ABC transporter, substrate-binding protein, family 3 [Leptospira johnsonii]
MVFRIFGILFSFLFLSPVFSQGISGSRLEEIQKRGELRVTGNRNFDPFYISDPKDGFPGFDAELGKKYAEFLGVKYTFTNRPEFEDYAEAIKSGEADIAFSGLSSTLERSKKGSFSSPYLVSTPGALVNKNALPPPPEGNIISTVYFRSVKDLESVSGLSFSVRAFSASHEYLLSIFPNSRIFTYGSMESAWNSVKEGQANCFVGDSLYIKGLILKQRSILSNFRALIEPVQENHVSALLPKGDIYFSRNFEFFLSELKRTGELKSLEDKYFNRNDWVK